MSKHVNCCTCTFFANADVEVWWMHSQFSRWQLRRSFLLKISAVRYGRVCNLLYGSTFKNAGMDAVCSWLQSVFRFSLVYICILTFCTWKCTLTCSHKTCPPLQEWTPYAVCMPTDKSQLALSFEDSIIITVPFTNLKTYLCMSVCSRGQIVERRSFHGS